MRFWGARGPCLYCVTPLEQGPALGRNPQRRNDGLTDNGRGLLRRENMQSSEFRLGQEAKIRLPNVDEVLDKGCALHAADDPALANTEAQKDARHIIEE